MGDEVIDLIAIAYGDRLSARGPGITDEIVEANINGLKRLLEKYLASESSLQPLPKLLSGNEIMQILNIEPSRELGRIVNMLYEAQISSDVVTKEEAVEFVKKIYKNFHIVN